MFPGGLETVQDDADERQFYVPRFVLETDSFSLFADNALVAVDLDKWSRAIAGENPLAGVPTRGTLLNTFQRNDLTGKTLQKTPTILDQGFFEAFARDLEGVIRFFYAENVRLLRPSRGESLRASKLYMHLYTQRIRGEGVELVLPVFAGPQKLTLNLEAHKIERLRSGRVSFRDVSFSTCDYHVPHYDFRSDHLWIKALDDGTYDFGAGSLEIVFEDSLHVPLPSLDGNTGAFQTTPLRGIRVGNSSKRGAFIGSRWGSSLIAVQRDLHRFLGMETRSGASSSWELDQEFTTNRGSAVDLRLQYEQPESYRGEMDLGYRYDPGRDRGFVRGGPSDRNRWRVRTRNRFHFSQNLSADLEFADRADRGFLAEFFEREYKNDDEQNATGYLRFAEEQWALELEGRHRTNRFDPQLERLPEARFHVPRFQLVQLPWSDGIGPYSDSSSGLYLDANVEVGRRRLRRGQVNHPIRRVVRQPEAFDEFTRKDFADASATRFAGHIQLSMPLWLGPLRFVPFARATALIHQDASETEDLARYAGSFGATLATEIATSGEGMFSHRLYPELTFTRTSLTGDRDMSWTPLGRTERELSRRDTVRLAVRNRFLEEAVTRGQPGVPVIDLDLDIETFPGALHGAVPEADNRFGNLNTLVALDWAGWLGLPRFEVFHEAEIDVSGRRDEVRRIPDSFSGVRLQPDQDLRLQVGFRQAHARRGPLPPGVFDDELRALEVGVLYELSERFEFELEARYDLNRDRDLNGELVLRRWGHDFITEARVDVDPAQGDTSFSIRFTPRLGTRRADRFGKRNIQQGLSAR